MITVLYRNITQDEERELFQDTRISRASMSDVFADRDRMVLQYEGVLEELKGLRRGVELVMDEVQYRHGYSIPAHAYNSPAYAKLEALLGKAAKGDEP